MARTAHGGAGGAGLAAGSQLAVCSRTWDLCNLRVKDVTARTGASHTTDRFIVCHNPQRATRDAAVRDELVTQLTSMIDGSDAANQRRCDELVGSLRHSPGLRRYLRRDQAGRLRVDQAAIAAETKLDGKWLLRCSDPTLPAEDVAAGYKQLLEVERDWRDLKTTLEMRPVFHHREDRIRAHVQLCWLALLLVRVAETTHRPDLASHAPRARPAPRRHLHRPGRDLLPAHRCDQRRDGRGVAPPTSRPADAPRPRCVGDQGGGRPRRARDAAARGRPPAAGCGVVMRHCAARPGARTTN